MSIQKKYFLFYPIFLGFLTFFILFSVLFYVEKYKLHPIKSEVNFAGEYLEGNNQLKTFYNSLDFSINNLYQFYFYIKRYNLYIPYIESELSKKNIPDDFKFIPIVESTLSTSARSNVGAVGLWQFMPDTARRFGLKVSDTLDERLDYKKSTEAAILYIEDLYKIFGNWTLVAAAYNRGENGLSNDMKRQGKYSYYDLTLNSETGNYIYKLLVVKYMVKFYLENKKVIDFLIGN